MSRAPADRLVPRFARAALPRETGCADREVPKSCPPPPGQATAASTLTPPGVGAALQLSDATLILLGSIALHDDLSIPSLITELAAARAKQIGLGVLARAVLDADASADSHAAHPATWGGNRHANSQGGDLHELPDFERTPATRFQKGGS